MVRSFFGQRSPSRSRVHEPIIESKSFTGQGGIAHYDTGDVGKSVESNWPELARHNKEVGQKRRKTSHWRLQRGARVFLSPI